jgi:hypothetical protein
LLPLADSRKELPRVELALPGRNAVSRVVRHSVPRNTLLVVRGLRRLFYTFVRYRTDDLLTGVIGF